MTKHSTAHKALLFVIFLFAAMASQTVASDLSSMPLFADLEPWISTLPPDKKGRALEIMANSHESILTLRTELHQKIIQLRAFRYDTTSSPETLPRLGRELQEARKALRKALLALEKDLAAVTGSAPNLTQLDCMHGKRHCRP